MSLETVSNYLWGHKARIYYLFIAASILLFTLLGSKELWTQEHRWADIVMGMFHRHDFLHPYLGETRYYDKPLLSYWFIALTASCIGHLSTWALRIPSVLAGLLALFSIYRLGIQIKDKQLGFLAAWLLLTTFYFVFWARTSSADMLNLAGALCAIAWYFEKRHHATFVDYMVFFIILALTSLCKGLVGAVVPLIAVLVDIYLQKSWQKHLRLILLLAIVPALVLYLLPFWASSYFGGDRYGENGLYLVYRENFLRYFEPFDHKGPIYTYFIYLPIYLFPSVIFFVPALWGIKNRWKTMTSESQWVVLTLLCLFLFFTLSGSRRSYYVLSIVPFATLLIADWLLSDPIKNKKPLAWSSSLVVTTYCLLLIVIDVLPAWYYAHFGVERFAADLKKEATKTKPWKDWQVVMLDGHTKLNFYLELPPNVKYYDIKAERDKINEAIVTKCWPILNNKPEHTIFITRKLYQPLLMKFFANYRLLELPSPHLPFSAAAEKNAPIAFFPIEETTGLTRR